MAKTKARRRKPVKKTGRPSKYGIVIKSAKDYCDLVWMEANAQGVSAMDIQRMTEKNRQRVSVSTIVKHMHHEVQNPQLRTAGAILRALGYELRVKGAR